MGAKYNTPRVLQVPDYLRGEEIAHTLQSVSEEVKLNLSAATVADISG
jgi:hypothetical protein